MAEKKQEEGRTPTASQTADVGVPYPEPMRQLAEDLPEEDEVQKAHKQVLLAKSAQQETRAKVKAVEASPDAADTPSGHALKQVADVSNDADRGEEYLGHKTAKRWGYRYTDES